MHIPYIRGPTITKGKYTCVSARIGTQREEEEEEKDDDSKFMI